MLPVLIACERSQVECMAFRALGIEAYSCDILDCYGNHPEWHIKADAIEVIKNNKWGLIIAHPPCTYMSAGGAQLMFPKGVINLSRYVLMLEAVKFFFEFYNYKDCPIAIENPRPLKICNLPPKTQVICPSEFGHEFTKRTYLWLRDLPILLPTTCKNISAKSYVDKYRQNDKRSRSFEGIAAAMAAQWSKFII